MVSLLVDSDDLGELADEVLEVEDVLPDAVEGE